MKAATALSVAVLLAGTLSFQACTSTESEDKCPGDTTSLIVNLGAPAGVSPVIFVSGPGGFRRTITSVGADTLSGLAAGEYSLSYKRFKVAGEIVGKAYFARIATPKVTLEACEPKTVTIAYEQEPGSERLYAVARNASRVRAFAAADIAATGTAAPAASFATPSGPQEIAFDAWGNLWVTHSQGVSMFAMEDLGTDGAAAKVVLGGSHVRGTGTPGPVALAFAPDSSLWIALGADDKVIRLAPGQLAASGSPEPGVVLSGPDLESPDALAFDSEGNLWVGGVTTGTNEDGLVRFDRERLAASHAGAADVKIVHRIPSLVYRGVADIAFDGQGDLLMGLTTGGHLLRLPEASQAASSDSLAPAMVLTVVAAGATPNGVAVDEAGGLWTTGSGALMRAAPSALAAGGVLAPDIKVASDALDVTNDVVLNPAPESLPLND